MAGLSANGLVIRTQPELQELLEATVRAAIPGIDLSQGPEQQIIGILSEELTLAWETLQAIYRAQGPEASGLALDQVAALTGTTRRAATASRVTASVTLAAGATLAAGKVAAVDGDPDAQFASVEAVTNSGASPAAFDVVFECLRTGPIAAPAGLLTVIVTASSGWTAITNATDATLGRDVAGDPELRTQRVVELAAGGLRTVDAIRANVARVDGVISVTVIENSTSVTDGAGRPGKSFEVIVWDGDPAAALDDEIAQAIYDTKPEGILSWGFGADAEGVGPTDSGTAIDESGTAFVVGFTRATKLRVYVSLEAVLEDDAVAGWEAQVKTAVSERADEYVVAERGYVSQLIAAILESEDGVRVVPSVKAVTTITMEADDPTPDDASVAPTTRQIIRIASADVTVAEDV
jgi:hypothetical protein